MARVNDKVLVYGREYTDFETLERRAGAGIKTGDLLEINDDGQFVPHSNDGGAVDVMEVAFDSRHLGQELGASYEMGDPVRAKRVHAGSVHMTLAQGQSVTEGQTKLVSNGDGSLRAAAGDGTEGGSVVAVADQDEDTTSSGTDAETYIPVVPASN